MNTETGQIIAVKQVFIGIHEKTKIALNELLNEINLMKNLEHQNIVRYLGAEIVSNNLNIFLEYVPGGSIYSLVLFFLMEDFEIQKV
jgi:serine/threonine protein kinase